MKVASWNRVSLGQRAWISWTKLRSLKPYDRGILIARRWLLDEATRITEALMAESVRAFVDSEKLLEE